ncbi:MAG TPA: hypothetical protein VIJ20_11330 [Solirubrobacteraceae bacterium]
MPNQPQEPGPGRSTSTAAFNEITKEIAQKNERAHKEARKLRAIRDEEQARMKRKHDL